MGFGGRVSLIGCKVGALNRLPASFFVSVAYDCWAYRRLGVVLDAHSGEIKRWLYRDPSTPVIPMADQAGFQSTGREVALRDAAHRGAGAVAAGRRRGAAVGPRVHRPRRRAPSPDVARAAGRSARRRHLPLRAGGGQGRRRLARHGRRAHDQHPRGALPGRHHQALRRPRRDRQGRHGRQDPGRAEGSGRRLPERDRRAPPSSTRGPSPRSTGCR